MFTEIYLEALLANEELADQVWDLWDKGLIDDRLAEMAWWIIGVEINGTVSAVPHINGTFQGVYLFTST